MALLLPFHGRAPRIAPDVFLAPTAVLIGDVTVEPEASIWFGAVLRADHPEHGIRVGPGSSVQDNCVLHVSARGPTLLGQGVTVGHGAAFESCEIRDGALVGMNAVILQGCVIGEESLVAAQSVVPEEMEVPPRSLVAGAPARVRKTLDGSAAEWVRKSAPHYVELSRRYLAQGIGTRERWVRPGERAGSDGDGGEGDAGEEGVQPSAPAVCELCGGPMMEVHCKLVCVRCGYQRDCSDP